MDTHRPVLTDLCNHCMHMVTIIVKIFVRDKLYRQDKNFVANCRQKWTMLDTSRQQILYNNCLSSTHHLAVMTFYKYRIRQNFRGGKLLRLCTKHATHWKTFTVHQAHAIMYCTQQMIQGENFRDYLKNRENRESFPPRKFCRIRYSKALFTHNINTIHQ